MRRGQLAVVVVAVQRAALHGRQRKDRVRWRCAIKVSHSDVRGDGCAQGLSVGSPVHDGGGAGGLHVDGPGSLADAPAAADGPTPDITWDAIPRGSGKGGERWDLRGKSGEVQAL